MYSYLDTQLDPNGDYTEQEKELERQRQLALALYKNVIGGANANAQATGPYNGLAAFLGQALGGLGAQKSESDFAAKQAEIDRNKAAAERKFYASIPQGTPGQPGGDMAADGMGPPTPTILPKPPSMQQYADWAGSAPQTPLAQKIAADTMQRFLPMSPDVAYQKDQDRQIKVMDLQRKASDALVRSQDRNLTLDERAQWHDRYATYLEDMGQQGLDVRKGMLKVAQTNAETNQQRLQTQQGLGGEVDYYNLSPEDQATVRGLVSGTANLTTFSQRNGQRALWQARVMNYAPLANLTAAPGVIKDMTSGPTAKNITSINTSLMHVGTMVDLVDALDNGQIPAANAAINMISKQTGNPEVTNFNTAKQAVGEELMRSFRGVGAGTEQEIQNWKSNFDAANSPEQLKGALRIAGELLGGRIKSVNDQFRRGTGSSTDFPGILSPGNVETLVKLGVKNTGLMDVGQSAPVPTYGIPPQPAVRPGSLPDPNGATNPLVGGPGSPAEAAFNQYKAVGRTTPEIGGGNSPMLPKPMSGKTVVKRKVLPDGRTAVLYSDGTDGFE